MIFPAAVKEKHFKASTFQDLTLQAFVQAVMRDHDPAAFLRQHGDPLRIRGVRSEALA